MWWEHRSQCSSSINTNFVPVANLSQCSRRCNSHLYHIGVFIFCRNRLNWGESQMRWRERRIWSSFTHLKIKHLTGSSACVSLPCGSALSKKHPHAPFEMWLCNIAAVVGALTPTSSHGKITPCHNIECGCPTDTNTQNYTSFQHKISNACFGVALI